MYLGRINFKGVQLTFRLLRYGHCLCCGLYLIAHPIVWLYDPSILCILHLLNIDLQSGALSTLTAEMQVWV